MVIGNGESLDSNINSIPDRSSSSLRGKKILLGVTGSVAAVKAPALVRQWVEMDGAHVQVLLTAGGRHFWDRAAVYENGSAVNDITREFQPRMTSRTALSATESNSDTPVSVAPIFGPGPLPASVQVHCEYI